MQKYNLTPMKIILNPKYEALREYLNHLEEHFEKEGKEIFRDRNVLRTLEVDGLTLCVKQYAPLSLKGRIAQRIYKSAKGKKAYFKPLALRERGFESPEPIAYVRYDKGLMQSTTYFVCLLSNYKHSMKDVMDMDEEERLELIKAFAHFVARLHTGGFLHRDFSPSNILFDKPDGRYHFALIDTNSIEIGRPVSVEKGCQNLAELDGDDQFFTTLAHAYALARDTDAETCEAYISSARKKIANSK